MAPVLVSTLTFLKKHWAVLVAVIVTAAVGFWLFHRTPTNAVDDIKKIQDNHAQETKKIDDARQEEVKKLEDNQKQLDTKLDDNAKKHEEQVKDLDQKKKDEVKKIVETDGEDPVKLAQELVDVLGGDVKIVMPEDK